MSHPHRKHDSAWKTFETFGVTVRRERPIRDADGHVSKRFELKGVRVQWGPKPAPRGVKRDRPVEELQLPSVHTGARLLSQEETYAPVVCKCGQPAERNSMFCHDCNSATRRYLAKFA